MILPETGEYSARIMRSAPLAAIGGRIWLDTSSRLTHVGSFEFHGNPSARFTAPEAAFA